MVTVRQRNLQDIQSISNKLMSILASIGIPLFYVALWAISVMLIFVYIYIWYQGWVIAWAVPVAIHAQDLIQPMI